MSTATESVVVGNGKALVPERKEAGGQGGGSGKVEPAGGHICNVRLRNVVFRVCNQYPRFVSRPDCFHYYLKTEVDGVSGEQEGCVPGVVKLTVVGPDSQVDELLATVQPGESVAEELGVELFLKKIHGSMLNKYDRPLGVHLGTIRNRGDTQGELVLREGLLPSEIGVTRALSENAPVFHQEMKD